MGVGGRLLVDLSPNRLPSSGSSAMLGRLYQETRMAMTSTKRWFRPEAANAAAMPCGLGLVDATGVIGSVPALAGRRMR